MRVELSQMGLVPLQETPVSYLAPPACEDTERRYCPWTRKWALTTYQISWYFSTSRSVRNKFEWFTSHPVYSTVIADWTKLSRQEKFLEWKYTNLQANRVYQMYIIKNHLTGILPNPRNIENYWYWSNRWGNGTMDNSININSTT